MTNRPIPTSYVLDTHALYWYLVEPGLLSRDALAVFEALERQEAVGLVPVVVVSEYYYLMRKRGWLLSVEAILQQLDAGPALRLEALSRQHLVAFGQIDDIPEMHDRFIAAVGLVHNAPIVTRDPVIQASARVSTVW